MMAYSIILTRPKICPRSLKVYFSMLPFLWTFLTVSSIKKKKTINQLFSTFTVDGQRTGDMMEDGIMDDSEPEAMIVDIEDVIEETASPLERVQPHQTPVYSVAASETTSIAVPLGTVASSHEPSPVFLIEIDENSDRKHWESNEWSQRESFSSEESLSAERSNTVKVWDNERNSSSNVDSEHWSFTSSTSNREIKEGLDKDSVKSNSSICSTDVDTESNVTKGGKKVEDHVNFERYMMLM